MLDFLSQGVLLCYFPLFMVILGFIAYAAITDGNARRTYLRRTDMRPEIEQLAMPGGAPPVRMPERAQTPSGMTLRFAESDVAAVVNPSAEAAVAVATDEPASEIDAALDMLTSDDTDAAPVAVAAEPVVRELEVVETVSAETPPPVKPKKAAKTPDQRNLRTIEGIGPKIMSVLNGAGIETFAQLAAKTPDQLREVLSAAGININANNPETWSEQAAMAAESRWDELEKLQDTLVAGRRK